MNQYSQFLLFHNISKYLHQFREEGKIILNNVTKEDVIEKENNEIVRQHISIFLFQKEKTLKDAQSNSSKSGNRVKEKVSLAKTKHRMF